ncbi:hypothetical protein BASA61_001853 [Batrachochytrium salamandrivorans]|nr:hypothetical protein BASA61_001853 [Batrachochytrium salamandrivorans]
MIVGTGIILSVLSSSVLAAVIPNDDDHGILLVRRAVNPESRVVLWKRADEKQRQIIPSKLESGTSTEAGDGAGSGGNSGSSKMGRFRDYILGLFNNLKTKWTARQKKSIEEKDKNLSKTPLRKPAYMLYNAPGTIPVFSLTIPNSSTQKSSTKAMLKMKNTGKQHTKTHLGDVVGAIGDLTKRPQNIIRELGIILESISTMCRKFEIMFNQEYMVLVSIVKRINNEGHIKDTQKYLSEMKDYRMEMSESFKFIKAMLESGRVTFKGKTSSRFDNFKSGFKKRLGFKKSSPTDVSPNPESSNQESSNPESSIRIHQVRRNQIRNQQDRYHHHGSQEPLN